MKVMCIIPDGYTWGHESSLQIHGYGPHYGDICTVIERVLNGHYVFLEYPEKDNAKYAYNPVDFIPLSSIDETELVNQRENVNA